MSETISKKALSVWLDSEISNKSWDLLVRHGFVQVKRELLSERFDSNQGDAARLREVLKKVKRIIEENDLALIGDILYLIDEALSCQTEDTLQPRGEGPR